MAQTASLRRAQTCSSARRHLPPPEWHLGAASFRCRRPPQSSFSPRVRSLRTPSIRRQTSGKSSAIDASSRGNALERPAHCSRAPRRFLKRIGGDLRCHRAQAVILSRRRQHRPTIVLVRVGRALSHRSCMRLLPSMLAWKIRARMAAGCGARVGAHGAFELCLPRLGGMTRRADVRGHRYLPR